MKIIFVHSPQMNILIQVLTLLILPIPLLMGKSCVLLLTGFKWLSTKSARNSFDPMKICPSSNITDQLIDEQYVYPYPYPTLTRIPKHKFFLMDGILSWNCPFCCPRKEVSVRRGGYLRAGNHCLMIPSSSPLLALISASFNYPPCNWGGLVVSRMQCQISD